MKREPCSKDKNGSRIAYISLVVSHTLRQKIVEIAKREGKTISSVVVDVLNETLLKDLSVKGGENRWEKNMWQT